MKKSPQCKHTEAPAIEKSKSREVFGYSPPGFSPQDGQTSYPTQLLTSNQASAHTPTGQSPAQLSSSEFGQGDEPVQMIIGNGGAENIGRLAHDKDYALAKITGLTDANFMPGAKWPSVPILYDLEFLNGSGTGFAMDNDPNYWLVDKANEASYQEKYSQTKSTLIPLRSFVLQGLADGRFILDPERRTIRPRSGGLYKDGTYPFVILADGTLQIAPTPSTGHTGLAVGNAVLMAGELSIANGKATYKSSQTGHYYTNEEEELRGIELMKTSYNWIADLRPKGFNPDGGRGLAALGLAVTGGTFGHLSKMKANFQAAKTIWEEHKGYWYIDAQMQTLKNQIVKYQQLDEEDNKVDFSEILPTLTRIVAVTGEILSDMEEAIAEALDTDEPPPFEGYDGQDPFADEDDDY